MTTKKERSELYFSRRKLDMPCPKCGFQYSNFKLIGQNDASIVLYCPKCGFCPAESGEGQVTSSLKSARKVWNAVAKRLLSTRNNIIKGVREDG